LFIVSLRTFILAYKYAFIKQNYNKKNIIRIIAPGTRKKNIIRKVQKFRGMFIFRSVPAILTKKIIKQAKTTDLSNHFKNLTTTLTR